MLSVIQAGLDYRTQELKLPVPDHFWERLKQPEKIGWVEFAHTPYFSHLGYARMLLSASRRARGSQHGVLLYFINDHLRANGALQERAIPMLRDGRWVKSPPRFGVSRLDSDRPLCSVPAPLPSNLLIAQKLAGEILSYEARSLPRLQKKAALAELEPLFDWLSQQAVQVESLSQWVTRCWLELLAQTHPDTVVLAVPSRKLCQIFPDAVESLATRRLEVARIQNCWARRSGEWPEWSQLRPVSEQYFPFQGLCHVCRDLVELPAEHGCGEVDWVPRVVARQPLADLLGLESRICGGPRGYWGAAEEISRDLLQAQPPPRVSLTGQVLLQTSNGIEAGASTLRVLAQLPWKQLSSQLLEGKDSQDVSVKVDFSDERTGG